MYSVSMLRTAMVLLLLVCIQSAAHAQNLYAFEKKTGSYADLEGATKIDTAHYGIGDLYFLDLRGETFWFYNIPYSFGGVKTFAMQQGNIRIDNDSSLIIVDGIFTYLDSIDATSDMSYRIEGKSGEKIIKTQWRNAKIREGGATNFVNVQIWVYQATGVIEIHYGPSSPNNQSGFNTSTGPQVGMFFAKDDFSKVFGKIWVNGSPSAYTLDSAKNLTFKAMSGVPTSGTIYRFIPRFAIPTGVQEEKKSKSDLYLYPNPASDELRLGMANDAHIYYCRIVSLTGEQVQESYEPVMSLSTVAQGMYMVEAQTTSGLKYKPLVKYE